MLFVPTRSLKKYNNFTFTTYEALMMYIKEQDEAKIHAIHDAWKKRKPRPRRDPVLTTGAETASASGIRTTKRGNKASSNQAIVYADDEVEGCGGGGGGIRRPRKQRDPKRRRIASFEEEEEDVVDEPVLSKRLQLTIQKICKERIEAEFKAMNPPAPPLLAAPHQPPTAAAAPPVPRPVPPVQPVVLPRPAYDAAAALPVVVPARPAPLPPPAQHALPSRPVLPSARPAAVAAAALVQVASM